MYYPLYHNGNPSSSPVSRTWEAQGDGLQKRAGGQRGEEAEQQYRRPAGAHAHMRHGLVVVPLREELDPHPHVQLTLQLRLLLVVL